jgi:hypothetical protein
MPLDDEELDDGVLSEEEADRLRMDWIGDLGEVLLPDEGEEEDDDEDEDWEYGDWDYEEDDEDDNG